MDATQFTTGHGYIGLNKLSSSVQSHNNTTRVKFVLTTDSVEWIMSSLFVYLCLIVKYLIKTHIGIGFDN